MSLILRHKPEAIDITLDEHGWANVDELIAGINRKHPLTMETLEQIVREDEKYPEGILVHDTYSSGQHGINKRKTGTERIL